MDVEAQWGPGPVDLPRIEAAVREILAAIGEDPDREGLKLTPARVARMYAEVCGGLHRDPAELRAVTFEVGLDEMVMVRDIPFASLCEHHLVPFIGKAHVAYIPNGSGRVIGLSKLARLVETYARRPQVQERLSTQVADSLVEALEPRGVLVVIEAEHLCMSMRGVNKPGASTVTSVVRATSAATPGPGRRPWASSSAVAVADGPPTRRGCCRPIRRTRCCRRRGPGGGGGRPPLAVGAGRAAARRR
ncbi:MAG: GTP cyclohydrolase I FolE [Acidimicrobiales bacterium]